MNDKISILMACYNCEGTLKKAVDSILAQTYTNWVMICCDDGSTDGTLSVLQEYKQKYPGKFVILQNETNRHLPYSLNRCIETAQTEIVARMDADDWSTPDRFEKQLAFMKAHPEADLVGTGICVSDGENVLTTIVQKAEPEPIDMLHANCFSHATIMTYKRVYDSLGGYSLNPKVERCEDIELWSRFFEKGYKGVNMPDLLYYILEDENAVKRRNFRNRLNTAYTYRLIYKRLHIHGVKAFVRPYIQILTYFIPMGLYNKLHIWNMKKNKNEQ